MSATAWVVRPLDVDEAGSQVVYAACSVEAVEAYAREFGIDARELDAARAEWADAYAPDEPPPSAWLAESYGVQCASCETVVTNEDEEPPIVHEGEVYCDQACKRKELRYRETRRRDIRHALKILGTHIPGVRVVYTVHGSCRVTPIHGMVGVVRFTFPGGAHEADWCGECRAAVVHPDDVAAFHAACAVPLRPDIPMIDRWRKSRAGCPECSDGEGGTRFPYYGVAPHDCFHKIPGAVMGQSRILPREQWPANFAPDPEDQGCGAYTHCLACGAGK